VSIEHDDLFERLRAANPMPAAGTAGRRASPDADELLQRVMRSRPRPRRSALVVIAITLLLVSALAAFAIVRAARAQHQIGVECYTSADLSSRRVVAPNAGDPVAACTRAWTAGTLGSGPVPHFALCVTPTDALGAFPGESGTTCQRLGLPVAIVDHDAAIVFAADLGRRTQAQCRNEAETRAVVEERLHAYGLTDWVVDVSRDHPLSLAEPCASVFIDTHGKRVVIISAPRSLFP